MTGVNQRPTTSTRRYSQTEFQPPPPQPLSTESQEITLFTTDANGNSQLDFSHLVGPQNDQIDLTTAEGRMEQKELEERERRGKAAEICIHNFSSMEQHLNHWPVNRNKYLKSE